MVQTCRVCDELLVEVIDFGKQPLGNGFLSSENFDTEYFFHMRAGFCEISKMFQLIEQPSPELMFHDKYAFYSSTSKHMQDHFKTFADSLMDSGYLDNNPLIVELGCNDGILLKNFVSKGFRTLGIEPSENVAKVANSHGIETIVEFFDEKLADDIVRKYGTVDAFLSANVMCHIPDINSVASGIKKLLKPTGVLMFEDPYLGSVFEKCSYDQLYDEHVFLFSALSVEYLFNQHGLELIDVIPQETQGGSMRYVLAHKGAYIPKDSVRKQIEFEVSLGLDKTKTYYELADRIVKSKEDLVNLLKSLKNSGHRIVGYAATSKSTTILNYCGIGPDLIEYICDTTPIKQGKYSPGVHIPVVPHSVFEHDNAKYAFLFAWNHSKEIRQKEGAYVNSGGVFITHIPKVGIL